MADTAEIEEEVEEKRSKMPLILGLVLALLGGGGGFFVMYSGMLGGSEEMAKAKPEMKDNPDLPMSDNGTEVAFVTIDPLVISLDQAGGTNLRFRASLEVSKDAESEVTNLLPRVVDVLNSYLRAVEVADLQDRSALTRIRAQMLRRVQVVAGGGAVKDLLIMEFVLN
ncbi:MAG: flagellar basal body-associated FliL family protein [Pseudomonadota bacterium]